MIRNAKALGVALVAVFALSAMAASSAFATSPAHFKADVKVVKPPEEPETATVKVEQDGDTTTGLQSFTTDFGRVDCHTFSGEAHVEAALSGTASSLTVKKVSYTGHQFLPSTKCEIVPLELEAEIKFNSCHYTFNAGTWLGGSPAKATGTADLVCTTAGDKVVISAPGCEITVPPQNGLSHIVYHQVTKTPAEADYVTAEANVANINYEGHKLLCATGLKTNGTYKGNAIATAFNANNARVDATIVQKT